MYLIIGRKAWFGRDAAPCSRQGCQPLRQALDQVSFDSSGKQKSNKTNQAVPLQVPTLPRNLWELHCAELLVIFCPEHCL